MYPSSRTYRCLENWAVIVMSSQCRFQKHQSFYSWSFPLKKDKRETYRLLLHSLCVWLAGGSKHCKRENMQNKDKAEEHGFWKKKKQVTKINCFRNWVPVAYLLICLFSKDRMYDIKEKGSEDKPAYIHTLLCHLFLCPFLHTATLKVLQRRYQQALLMKKRSEDLSNLMEDHTWRTVCQRR